MTNITERRLIEIQLGPNESFQSALVRAKKQIDVVPDNVILITLTIFKENANTQEA